MSEGWFYVSGETELGPFSLEQLQKLLADGKIRGDTMVRNRSWMEWQPASQWLFGNRGKKPGRKDPQQTGKSKVEPSRPGPPANQEPPGSSDLLQPKEYFDYYLNPFEVFQIESNKITGQLVVAEIQRAKKLLVHELRLNDGRVEWLNGLSLDESRVNSLENDLYDPARLRYHAAIFHDKRLLAFLTRGTLQLFCQVGDGGRHLPLDLIEREPAFRAFVSKPFAQQYNRVLTRAIDRKLLPVVKSILQEYGRRWVDPKDDDVCFDGAYKRIASLLDALRVTADEGSRRKLSFREIEDFLRNHSLPDLFNLLPPHFEKYQTDAVQEVRSLAVDCYNVHHDPGLSKAILRLCDGFSFRNEELRARLKKDNSTIDSILRREIPGSPQPANATKGADGSQTIAGFLASLPRPVLSWGILILILLIIGGISSLLDQKPTSSVTPLAPAYTPPTYTPPTYSADSAPSTATSSTKTTYRVPSYIRLELDRDSRVIDEEKAKADRLATEVESLSRELDQMRLYLDRTSRFAIDSFNSKVDAHNALLRRVRAQNDHVNQLVTAYNNKLRTYGR
jgi:hypothetical protein